MFHVTYAHYKPDGTMFYIGKGSVKRAYSRAGRNVVWRRTVEKHGGFSVEILARWQTEQEAFDHECFLIDTMRGMEIHLANIAEGGMGSTGFRHTEEHKKRLAECMKEKNPMHDPQVRKKQVEALKVAMSRPDIRRRISQALAGKKLSESHVEALRNCHPTKPCVINGVVYKSLMEASRMLGIRHGTIHRWLNHPEIKRGAKYAHITECRWA